jgi:predicted aconitase with swiveling domain
MKWRGRKIYAGVATGEVIASNMGISFFGGVDPESGIVVERDHDLEGQSIAGKVLVFPTGSKAPVAIVNAECETITAVGCIIAEIPCVDQVPIEQLQSGQQLEVDGVRGVVILIRD